MKTLPIDLNFLGIEEQYSSYDRSRFAIVSAPYEHTVSYGTGTALAPAAILDASHYVEFFDEEMQREVCFEQGIATLEPLDFEGAVNESAFQKIYDCVATLLAAEKFVVTLGGEHSISPAPIRAHQLRYPNMSVLQFDAHSDLRRDYQGNQFSHASAMARVLDFLQPTSLVQVGIRAQCREEFEWIRDAGINTFYAYAIRSGKHGERWQQAVLDTLAEDVYITFDVDCFDPSIMPTTGTPEPGGLLWDETMSLLRLVGEQRRIVGFDVVELSPSEANVAPTYLTAKLIYKIMNYSASRRG